MFVKMTISWVVRQLVKMFEKGTIVVDNNVQRAFKWEVTRMSLLIHSMLCDYPIPPFYARRKERVYDFLDGKQRILAVVKYLHGEYALKDVPPVEVDGEEIDVNGMKFEDLPEELQDKIQGYALTIYYFDGITDDEVRSLFHRLNNGKPLNAKERAIANCADLDTLMEIGNHEFFRAICTEKAITERKPVALLAKMYMMLYMDISDVSFGSKDINSVMENMSITEDEKADLVEILDRAKAVYDICLTGKKIVARRFGTETHFVSLVPFLKKSIDEHYTVEKMARFVTSLFEDKVIISDEYMGLCQSGSNGNASIVARNRLIDAEWAWFFNDEDEEEYNERVAKEEALKQADTESAITDHSAEVPSMTITETKPEVFQYGMRLRGCAPGCQPDGFISFEDDTDGFKSVLTYERELTDEEVSEYELTRI